MQSANSSSSDHEAMSPSSNRNLRKRRKTEINPVTPNQGKNSPKKCEKNQNLSNSTDSKSSGSENEHLDNSKQKGIPLKVEDSTDDIILQIRRIASDAARLRFPEAYNNIKRDKFSRIKENAGRIEVHVICNSPFQVISDQLRIWLLELQSIFSHELSRMNKSYITRIVFDPRHRNIVLVEGGCVVGGISFRMFPTQDFSEVVFVAVTSSKHVNGYGSHLMNHLKNYNIEKNIHHLLTFASYEAFGYFEKQGFSDKITLSETAYKGYINEYEGAALMECKLDPRISYTELSEITSIQKKIVEALIKEHERASEPLIRPKSDLNLRKPKK